MARRTTLETIAFYETRRDTLEAKIDAIEATKALQSQGNQGSRSEFNDPLKLQEMLDKINNKLALLYRHTGA